LKKPHIIFATLGRLLEHLGKEYICLNNLKILAVDEADKFDLTGKKKAWQDLDIVIDSLPKDV
jgi:superfamily II DNA/RNA helicase